jgi:hypothetical protein
MASVTAFAFVLAIVKKLIESAVISVLVFRLNKFFDFFGMALICFLRW